MEGLIFIAQHRNTTQWKALVVTFNMVVEPLLYDKYFPRYSLKCKAVSKNKKARLMNRIVQKIINIYRTAS